MVAAIAQILKSQIGSLPWIERYAGLVFAAAKPVKANSSAFLGNTDSRNQYRGGLVFPVACDAENVDCWNDDQLKYMTPDSGIASLAFFVDNGGTEFVEFIGPNWTLHRYRFNLRFLFWADARQLDMAACGASGKLAPYITSRLLTRKAGGLNTVGVFGGGMEEETYFNVFVTKIVQPKKEPSLFNPFTFAQTGVDRGIFLPPYDYFALNIQGTFDIPANCLPELFAPGFEFVRGNCLQP